MLQPFTDSARKPRRQSCHRHPLLQFQSGLNAQCAKLLRTSWCVPKPVLHCAAWQTAHGNVNLHDLRDITFTSVMLVNTCKTSLPSFPLPSNNKWTHHMRRLCSCSL